MTQVSNVMLVMLHRYMCYVKLVLLINNVNMSHGFDSKFMQAEAGAHNQRFRRRKKLRDDSNDKLELEAKLIIRVNINVDI